MPRKNTFMLVSLQEDKAKELAKIVSNDTSKKILDYLSEKEATETEIAKDLGLPISTIHYNIQQLKKTGMIDAEKFHYSEKGKEVLHYKLANKYIIIAPKPVFGIKEKLRSILPIGLIGLGVAAILQLFRKGFYKTSTMIGSPLGVPLGAPAEEVSREVATSGAKMATDDAVYSAAPSLEWFGDGMMNVTANAMDNDAAAMTEVVNQTVVITQEPTIWANPAIWLLIGVFGALGLYLLFSWLFRKK
jgi:DNA-binding transcriptional ArsR family regulator